MHPRCSGGVQVQSGHRSSLAFSLGRQALVRSTSAARTFRGSERCAVRQQKHQRGRQQGCRSACAGRLVTVCRAPVPDRTSSARPKPCPEEPTGVGSDDGTRNRAGCAQKALTPAIHHDARCPLKVFKMLLRCGPHGGCAWVSLDDVCQSTNLMDICRVFGGSQWTAYIAVTRYICVPGIAGGCRCMMLLSFRTSLVALIATSLHPLACALSSSVRVHALTKNPDEILGYTSSDA